MPSQNKMYTALPARLIFTGSVDFASVAATTVADQTVTVKGLRKNAPLVLHIPGLEAGLVFSNAHASADDTLKVRFFNQTGAPVDPAAQAIYLVQF